MKIKLYDFICYGGGGSNIEIFNDIGDDKFHTVFKGTVDEYFENPVLPFNIVKGFSVDPAGILYIDTDYVEVDKINILW